MALPLPGLYALQGVNAVTTAVLQLHPPASSAVSALS